MAETATGKLFVLPTEDDQYRVVFESNEGKTSTVVMLKDQDGKIEVVKEGEKQTEGQALTPDKIQKFLGYYEKEHSMTLFLNMKEEPMVLLPTTEGNDRDGVQGEGLTGESYPLKHGRVKTWLLRHLVDYFKLKKKPDIGTVLLWMECLAYEHGVDELLKEDAATVAETVDDDPLFRAVYDHTISLQTKGEVKIEKASDGYKSLKNQVPAGMTRGWPTRPSDVSRQLGNMSEALEEILGVKFMVKHTNAGSVWKWERIKPAKALKTTTPEDKGLFELLRQEQK